MYETSHELDYSDDEVLQAGALISAVVLAGTVAKHAAEQRGASKPRAIMQGTGPMEVQVRHEPGSVPPVNSRHIV